MNRFLPYSTAAAAILAAWLGWHFGSLHWRGKHDQLVATMTSESARITAESAAKAQKDREVYDANYTAISNAYHRELAAAADNADNVTRKLREYENRLRALSVPKATTSATRADAACKEPASDPRIREAVGRVIAAAGLDAATLTALQQERASLSLGASPPTSASPRAR